MTEVRKRCTVCGKEDPEGSTICRHCQAVIRGQAAGEQHQERKDADRELRKKGSESAGDKPTHR